MNTLEKIQHRIILGNSIEKQTALSLLSFPVDELCQAADEIRAYFMQNTADICAIINVKCGKCSEDCKFCAQASIYGENSESHALMDPEQILAQSQKTEQAQIKRISLVSSGRRPNSKDLKSLGQSIQRMRNEQNLLPCVSLGLLEKDDYLYLKDCGLERVHNNLESSENYFPKICTTHTFSQKVTSIKTAQSCGLEVCSGGLFGLGESFEDRIDMAFSLADLQIKSIPINILFPIKGTPFENNHPLSRDEIRQLVAIYRFILPDSFLRLAGGRKLMLDQGKELFSCGINAMITGDLLTTSGPSMESDLSLLQQLGFTNLQ